jgi:hypothetical protein
MNNYLMYTIINGTLHFLKQVKSHEVEYTTDWKEAELLQDLEMIEFTEANLGVKRVELSKYISYHNFNLQMMKEIFMNLDNWLNNNEPIDKTHVFTLLSIWEAFNEEPLLMYNKITNSINQLKAFDKVLETFA